MSDLSDGLLDEVNELLDEVKRLKSECRRHAGNVVEVYAYATRCVRHKPHARSCVWTDDYPCECRAAVSVYFPEYAGNTPHGAGGGAE